jgi:hypothetical protein
VQVVVQPVHVVAVVLDAVLLPESFSNVDATLFVNRKRHRIRQHRLGREQASDHAFGKFEPFQSPFALVRCRSDCRVVGRLFLSKRKARNDGSNQGDGDRDSS